MHKLKQAYALFVVSFALGATLGEKIRLAWFLTYSRANKHAPLASKRFEIISRGMRLAVYIRNTFADPFILREAFMSHDYDKGLPTEAPNVIFDIGANLGYVTLYFKSCFPNAKIYCFEPDPDNYAELIKNTGNFPDIHCFNIGIGAKEETRSFYKSPIFHMRNSLVPEEGSEKIEIKLISLEDAVRLAGVSRIGLMKFDVEGAEKEFVPAFGGFDKVDAIVGELHPHLMSKDEYKQIVEKLGHYYGLAIDDSDRKRVFFYGAKQ